METLDIIFLVLVTVVCVAAFWRDVMGSPSEPEYTPVIPPEPSEEDLAILNQHRKEYVPMPFDSRYATLENEGWQLVDVTFEATESFYGFRLPSAIQKLNLKRGQLVQLRFSHVDYEYRDFMWVEILSNSNGVFNGIIHDIVYDDTLQEGKEIWFHANHIMSIREY